MKLRRSRSGEYPYADARKSAKKQYANDLILSAFRDQGLGANTTMPMGGARILILDTPELRTTQTLLRHAWQHIHQVIVVERKREVYHKIVLAINDLQLGAVVTAIYGDAVEYLAELQGARIDFIWLDAMASYPDKRGVLPAVAARLATRCFAVTLSNRLSKGDTHRKRADRAANAFSSVLPHKILDWGYNLTAKRQCMQLVAFGVKPSPCIYGARTKMPVVGDPESTLVEWYGYPNEWTLESGRPEEW